MFFGANSGSTANVATFSPKIKKLFLTISIIYAKIKKTMFIGNRMTNKK